MLKRLFVRVKRAAQLMVQGRAIYTFILMMLALNMLIVTSLSWFTMNKQADSENMGMSLAVDDTSAVYKAFMYDMKQGKGVDTNPEGGILDITNLDGHI